MNDFYSKLRQQLHSNAEAVNYYAKEKDLGRNHVNYGAQLWQEYLKSWDIQHLLQYMRMMKDI